METSGTQECGPWHHVKHKVYSPMHLNMPQKFGCLLPEHFWSAFQDHICGDVLTELNLGVCAIIFFLFDFAVIPYSDFSRKCILAWCDICKVPAYSYNWGDKLHPRAGQGGEGGPWQSFLQECQQCGCIKWHSTQARRPLKWFENASVIWLSL